MLICLHTGSQSYLLEIKTILYVPLLVGGQQKGFSLLATQKVTLSYSCLGQLKHPCAAVCAGPLSGALLH